MMSHLKHTHIVSCAVCQAWFAKKYYFLSIIFLIKLFPLLQCFFHLHQEPIGGGAIQDAVIENK